MFSIRVITADDWPTWRLLRLAALTEAPDAFGSTLSEWQGDGDREARWRDRLSIPGAIDLLAIRDSVAVAMLSGVPDKDDNTRVWLMSMWVAPSERGRKVSRKLVEHVVDWARLTGRTSVNLMVRQHNVRAIKLYEHCGFSDTDYRKFGSDASGVEWTEIEMTRPLN